MDASAPFADGPVDRTPYGAFWVVGAVLILLVGGGSAALLRAAPALQRDRHAGGSLDGATGREILERARDAAAAAAGEAASRAASDAASRATQELLQRKDAVIRQAEDAAAEGAKKEAQVRVQESTDSFRRYLQK